LEFWKYESSTTDTIAALRDYEDAKTIMEITERNIRDTRDTISAPRSPPLDGMPFARSNSDTKEKQIDRIIALERRYQKAYEFVKWFEPCWEVLSKKERRVLEEYYLQGGFRNGARYRLAKELNYSVRQIERLRNTAIERLQSLLFI